MDPASQKLFFVLVGALPVGRRIEQHDIYFGIAPTITALKPELIEFWPEAKDKMHVDAYRIISQIGDYSIQIVPKASSFITSDFKLFFINLGGYKPGEMEEFHYKSLIVAKTKAEAIKQAKETSFYKHTGFESAVSHIDDKYGIDVDDFFEIEEALPAHIVDSYKVQISYNPGGIEDVLNIGYYKFDRL